MTKRYIFQIVELKSSSSANGTLNIENDLCTSTELTEQYLYSN